MEIPTLTRKTESLNKPGENVSVMFQNWRDILFLHWEYEPEVIQKTLPDGLFVDTYYEKAFLGITPFFLYDVRPRHFPQIKPMSNFCGINVRTYVHDYSGKPGVYFYSIDANQPDASNLAEFFYLPYNNSKIESEKNDFTGEVYFKCIRKNTRSEFAYRFSGKEFYAGTDTIEHFLIERYFLFSYNRENDQLYRGRVFHIPYPLFNAALLKFNDSLLNINGFETGGKEPDHIIASSGVDAAIFNIEQI